LYNYHGLLATIEGNGNGNGNGAMQTGKMNLENPWQYRVFGFYTLSNEFCSKDNVAHGTPYQPKRAE
jgi:hypothetical protein